MNSEITKLIASVISGLSSTSSGYNAAQNTGAVFSDLNTAVVNLDILGIPSYTATANTAELQALVTPASPPPHGVQQDHHTAFTLKAQRVMKHCLAALTTAPKTSLAAFGGLPFAPTAENQILAGFCAFGQYFVNCASIDKTLSKVAEWKSNQSGASATDRSQFTVGVALALALAFAISIPGAISSTAMLATSLIYGYDALNGQLTTSQLALISGIGTALSLPVIAGITRGIISLYRNLWSCKATLSQRWREGRYCIIPLLLTLVIAYYRFQTDFFITYNAIIYINQWITGNLGKIINYDSIIKICCWIISLLGAGRSINNYATIDYLLTLLFQYGDKVWSWITQHWKEKPMYQELNSPPVSMAGDYADDMV